VSPIAVIPKPRSIKWRLIHNLSHGGRHSVNSRIPDELGTVQYPTFAEIAAEILSHGRGTWFFTFDLEEAFRQVPVHPDDWQYQIFEWRGCYYVDTRLGFGSKTGPRNWDRVGRALTAIMEANGIHLLRMVDDHMGFGDEHASASDSQLRAFGILSMLGFPRAVHKDVGPVQEVDFNGIRWSSLTLMASIPLAKWDVIRAELLDLIELPLVQLSCFRSTVGRLTHLLGVVPMGKAFLQECFMLVHWHSNSLLSRWPSGREPIGAAAKTWLSLTPTAKAELSWWLSVLGFRHDLAPARPLQFIVDCQPCAVDPASPWLMVSVDASGVGLGASFGHRWSFSPISRYLAWTLAQRGGSGSTLVELGAVLLACVTWGHEWMGRHVVIRTDNSGAFSSWSRLHSPVPRQAELIRAVALLSIHYGFWLSIVWIPGDRNVVADAISRSRWQLLRSLVPLAAPNPSPYPAHALLLWLATFAG